MGSPSVKLPLTEAERGELRRNRIKISQLSRMSCGELKAITSIPAERAKELVALATFQTIPDIGPAMAECLVLLGYSHPRELQGANPAKLLDNLEERLGYWVDPCVEDELWLAVHFADHPEIPRRWWDFTHDRKLYRAKHGYPPTRPTLAWDDPSRKGK
jgi:hypothetical protein